MPDMAVFPNDGVSVAVAMQNAAILKSLPLARSTARSHHAVRRVGRCRHRLPQSHRQSRRHWDGQTPSGEPPELTPQRRNSSRLLTSFPHRIALLGKRQRPFKCRSLNAEPTDSVSTRRCEYSDTLLLPAFRWWCGRSLQRRNRQRGAVNQLLRQFAGVIHQFRLANHAVDYPPRTPFCAHCLPVITISLTMAGGRIFGRRSTPPLSGTMPSLASGRAKLALSAQTIKSAASASSKPPPKA